MNKNLIILTIVIILILIIILCLVLVPKSKSNLNSNLNSNNNKKIAIILTMHSRDNLVNIYFKNIRNWLESKHDIYIVDSNDKFSDIYKQFETYNNFNSLIFDQNKLENFKNNLSSSSVLETDSLKLLFDKFDFSKYDCIFKITCKYYFNFDEILSKFKIEDNTLYVQFCNHSEKCNNWHSTELFGASYEIFKDILLEYKNIAIEEHLANIKKKYNYISFDKIKIKSKPVKRGSGDILKYL